MIYYSTIIQYCCSNPTRWKMKIAITCDKKNHAWPSATCDFFSSLVISNFDVSTCEVPATIYFYGNCGWKVDLGIFFTHEKKTTISTFQLKNIFFTPAHVYQHNSPNQLPYCITQRYSYSIYDSELHMLVGTFEKKNYFAQCIPTITWFLS